MKKRKLLLASLVTGLVGLAPLSASANTIEVDPFPVGFIVPNGSGEFTYNYNVFLTTGRSVTDNSPPGASRFTIYDVSAIDISTADFVPILVAGDFTMTISPTGPSYGGSTVPIGNTNPDIEDDSVLVNLTGTYTGTTYTNILPGGVRALVGTLSFRSTVGTSGSLEQNSFDASGVNGVNSGPRTTQGPVESPGGPPITPLPVAAWAGLGFFGLMGAGKIRRKK